MARMARLPWRGLLTGGVLAATLALSTGSADEPDCCSCAVSGSKTLTGTQLPCLFDYPAPWDAMVGNDGALVSAVVTPASCDTACPNGAPGLSASFGTRPDSNADTMEEIWRQVMPVVGSARCGDATVNFYSPPGSDDLGLIGGVKFFVSVAGKKYSGAANFTCGQPGGWLALRRLFIDSFRDNPESQYGTHAE